MKYAFISVPKEPDSDIIEKLYGPWLSTSAHETRCDAYRSFVKHVAQWEGADPQPWDGRERRKEDALGFAVDSDWREK